MNNILEILKNHYVQLVLALVVGVTVGAVFYPSSRTEEHVREEMKQKYELQIKESEEIHARQTQELTDKLDTQEQSHKEYKEETQHKVEKLVQENSTLKQSVKRKKLKIIKPDGTVVEQEIEESNTEATTTVITQVKEEFTRKVQEIEDKWKRIHEERVARMQSEFDAQLEKARSETKTVEVIVEKDKIVEVNKKALRPEIGVTTDRDVYLHGTYNVWGPTFIGGGVSGTNKGFGEARLGVGLEF